MSYKDALSHSKEGILLKLHVIPSSSQSLFPAGYNQWRKCIEIKVQSEAKEGKANTEVLEQIAAYFDIPEKNITIVSGHKGRDKTISIRNVPMVHVCKKLEESPWITKNPSKN